MNQDQMLQLLDDYLDGSADDAAVTQLKAWLAADPANLDEFARQVFIHQQLRESLVADNSARFLAESSNPAAMETLSPPAKFPHGLGAGSWIRSPLGLLLLVMLMLTAGSYAAFRLGWLGGFISNRAGLQGVISAGGAVYEAKLVKLTNCTWDSSRGTADLNRGSQISPGQSLCLLEGVAEINSQWSDKQVAKFILEGPVSLMMTNQGAPSLQFGKLSVAVSGANNLFTLDTCLGSVIASGDASFGIISDANKVELHVFFGSVAFEPAQLFLADRLTVPLKASAGSSLRLALGPERTIAVQTGAAEEEAFITPASLNASHLNIPEAYVAAIKQAKPVAYWRFDRVLDNVVPNEMGERFACRVQGNVGWRTYPNGNRTAEFGASTQPGLLLSDNDLADMIKNQYSIEFWMKPEYCHVGSMFSLVKCNADSSVIPGHGVLVEVVGPASDPSSPVSQIDRIRFLHRSPANADPRFGTSCYSDQVYTPRIWQQVVAVKDGPQMKLFLNGKLAAEGWDSSSVPMGLRVLMGQLYGFTSGPNAATRPFVGELDEVALYDRPLTPAEIIQHGKLARPKQSSGNSW